MKKNLLIGIMGLGWILFALSILAGYQLNRLSIDESELHFIPISWDDQMQLFDGLVECTLSADDLEERKLLLKKNIFTHVVNKEKTANGFVYYFAYEEILLENLMEFVIREKACCPFFKFDMSILPFNKGLALQISGSKEAIELLIDFENNNY